MSAASITALKRFGLGQWPGQINAIAGDPQGYVISQLDQPDRLLIDADMVSTAEAWRLRRIFSVARRQARKAGTMKTPQAIVRRKFYQMEVDAHISHAIATDTPFLERLSWFWSNHFCVSGAKFPVRHLTGGYIREAIRPHVLGRFRDMLQAVVRHPAMLIYLDNTKSFGPDSPAGLRLKRGLNENLAREVLELHTLGVNGGYNQQDIINFAKALTGWRFGGLKSPAPGQFRFARNIHQPGTVKVLGKSYQQSGQDQAEAILDDLASHPSTARFIARKLAVHFVGDNAPQDLIDQLATTFSDTDGNLRAVAESLAKAPQSWQQPAVKFLSPLEALVTVSRALDTPPSAVFARQTLRFLGQPMWSPPSPAGWPDGNNSWASGDALLERLDWAFRYAALIPRETRRDVAGLAADLFGDTLSHDTTQAIARAPTRKDAFSLLLLSPEMQRR